MPRGGWGIYAALGIGAAVGILLLGHSAGIGDQVAGSYRANRYYAEAQHAQSTENRSGALGPCMDRGESQGSESNQAACDPNYYNRRDLEQQTNMAVAAWSQFFATIVSIALILWTLNLSIAATRAAVDQAQAARRSIAQPFMQVVGLGLELLEERIEREDRGREERGLAGAIRQFQAREDWAWYRAINHGSAPAIITHVERRLVLVDISNPLPSKIDTSAVTGIEVPHGMIVAANGGESEPLIAIRRRNAAEEPLSLLEDWWLYGFIRYGDGYGREYVTGFCFNHTGTRWQRQNPPGTKPEEMNYHREIEPPPGKVTLTERLKGAWSALTK